MRVAVLTTQALKSEILEKGVRAEVTLVWVNDLRELLAKNADVYMDLLFEKDMERIGRLESIFPKPVFINSVTYTLAELGQPLIRLNGWPGFLNRKIIEIAVNGEAQREVAAAVLSKLGWDFAAVPDEPGMITARVISMIVNEAYFALGEGVSTKDEIDIAMKLGTNYPYGPFEWSKRIGLLSIYALLSKLCERDSRYLIADSMVEEVKTTYPSLFHNQQSKPG